MRAAANTPPAGWVPISRAGYGRGQIEYMRASGKLVEGADCVRIKTPRRGTHRHRWYYRPEALKTAADEIARPYSEKIRKWWQGHAAITVGDDELVALKNAAEIVGVSGHTISRWTLFGCPHLDGRRLRTETRDAPRAGGKLRYWSRAELERVRDQRQQQTADGIVKHRGHTLRAKPPKPGLPMIRACREYHISTQALWRLIDRGIVPAGRGAPCGGGGRRQIIVSAEAVRRHKDATPTCTRARLLGDDPPPHDGVPVNSIARELDVDNELIRRWCQWDPHPGLGRKMRSGVGPYTITERTTGKQLQWRGLLVSRSDAEKLVAMVKQPAYKQIPGNPGEWIADGIFRHDDGRVFLTGGYALNHKDRFGLWRGAFGRSLVRGDARDRKGESAAPVASLLVILPGSRCPNNGRWRVRVYAEADMLALAHRRTHKTDGDWTIDNELWRDAEGLWFSRKHLCRIVPGARADTFLREYEQTGRLTRRKYVPLVRRGGAHDGKRSARAVVYHESEALPLLRVGGPPAVPVATIGNTHPPSSDFVVVVGAEYGSGGCVRVGGEVVPVSFGTWKLLRLLAVARDAGSAVTKTEMERIDANPVATLKRFIAKCPAGVPAVLFPGRKSIGGYRLL